MQPVAEVAVDPARALVHESGWQSWSPTATYRVSDEPHRPISDWRRLMNYRPGVVVPPGAFQGEGLLAVDPGTGDDVHVVAARGPDAVPSVRAELRGDRVVVSADGDVTVERHPGPVDAALGRWAEGFAAAAGVGPLRAAPTAWCSWYHYFTAVTEADVDENLAAMDELALDVEVVQIDDGYQAELGDWLTLSDRFSSLAGAVERIRARGRRAGIWVAPFLVGERSQLRREHPEWLVGGAGAPLHAGHGWEQDLTALDATHPGAEEYLREVFGSLAALGIDYFKIDFTYAGALDGPRADDGVSGVEAYRRGLRAIRGAIGDEAYLLGCGAPILPSVGLVDAMRVSPDIAAYAEPPDGDMSQPSQRAAVLMGRERAWQHGRFWVNDTDCLIAAPVVAQREEWAEHVGRVGGLRASSDRLRALDDWGLATTRRLLTRVPATPFGPVSGMGG